MFIFIQCLLLAFLIIWRKKIWSVNPVRKADLEIQLLSGHGLFLVQTTRMWHFVWVVPFSSEDGRERDFGAGGALLKTQGWKTARDDLLEKRSGNSPIEVLKSQNNHSFTFCSPKSTQLSDQLCARDDLPQYQEVPLQRDPLIQSASPHWAQDSQPNPAAHSWWAFGARCLLIILLGPLLNQSSLRFS